MSLKSVTKALIIGVLVFLLTLSVSFMTTSLVINFMMGYVFGSLGVFAWFKWVDA